MEGHLFVSAKNDQRRNLQNYFKPDSIMRICLFLLR